MPQAPGEVQAGGREATATRYAQSDLSYAQQFAVLKGAKDTALLDRPHPKPSLEAARREPNSGSVPLSDVAVCAVQRPLFDPGVPLRTLTRAEADRHQLLNTAARAFGFWLVHTHVLLGCWPTFTWTRFAIGLVIYAVTNCLGISVCYHRLLTHRSFKTFRVVEYALAYLGLHGLQGPPMEWVENHRIHHLHTDTPLDPHSPYEGFWHAHMGWLLGKADTDRPMLDCSHVAELSCQAFYRALQATWLTQMVARWLATWYLAGFAWSIWLFHFPIFASWHATFFVNSGSHLWGPQEFDTGDLSRNNWWVAMVSFGEGFHNTHHAFASSARYGLQWWQFDAGYCCIAAMRALGLAWDVRLPSARDLERARKPNGKQKAW